MDVDDYVFEPCGYSMNGLCGDEYSTVHITPEAGFSYCSVEHSNVPVSVADPEAYARKVAATFNPGRFSLAVSTDAPLAAAADIRRVPSLPGYRRVQASHQEIDASGGAVSFYTFVKETRGSRRRAPAAAGAAEQKAGAEPLLAAGSDKYESDEEAPERKKMRAGSPTSPGTPSLAGPGGGSMVAESVDFLRAPSVNHLPALPAASARWREDSMPYLRALYLSGELGAPGPLLAAWRARAAAAMPAFWRHVAGRGVDQRLNFAKLFRGLGLAAEADLVAFERATRRATHVARRRPLAWFLLSADRPYDLTHEVFALTRDGRAPFPGAGDPAAALAADAPLSDHAYALRTAAALLKVCVRRDALDAACELLANLGQLGARAGGDALGELYRQAADYVASRRNADGSFGETHDAARVRAAKGNPAYDVEVGGTLHTTFVCLWALAQRPGGGVDVSRPA